MASMVAKACNSNSSQLSSAMLVQEKGSRNKRKLDLGLSSAMIKCYADHADALKLDLGLSCAVGPFEARTTSKPKEENMATDDVHDADWSDLTESQLEELVLNNLDTIFKSAIKKLVDCGYTEEFATRSGLCYGCKDTVSNIVDNTLAFLRNGQELDPSREQDFEDLQQMEKYILAELVCVIREVKSFFTTGDAMWCLLVCDMNVSLACAMESDPFSSFLGDGAPNGTVTAPVQPQARTESRSSENLLTAGRQNPSFACACHCPSETSIMATVPCMHISPEAPTMTVRSNLKPRNSSVQNGISKEMGTCLPQDTLHNDLLSTNGLPPTLSLDDPRFELVGF